MAAQRSTYFCSRLVLWPDWPRFARIFPAALRWEQNEPVLSKYIVLLQLSWAEEVKELSGVLIKELLDESEPQRGTWAHFREGLICCRHLSKFAQSLFISSFMLLPSINLTSNNGLIVVCNAFQISAFKHVLDNLFLNIWWTRVNAPYNPFERVVSLL